MTSLLVSLKQEVVIFRCTIFHFLTYTLTVLHTLTHSQGSVVEAKMISGTVYEGILTEFSPKLEIFLEEVHDKAKVMY